MRIGINAMYWIPNSMGGTQTYLLRLVEALLASDEQHEYVIFLNREGAAAFAPHSSRLRVEVCPVRGRNRLARLLWENAALGRRARALKLDVVHSLGYLSPIYLPTKSVVTVLDMIHYIRPDEIARSKRYLWRLLLPSTLRRVDRIITISESVKREVARFFPRAEAKTVAIPLAVDTARFTPGEGLRDSDPGGADARPPAILAVASMAPHKNMAVLVRAVARLRRDGHAVRLLLVGQETVTTAELRPLAASLGLGPGDVEFSGRVSDEALVRLYREAVVLVFPSLYEGFGLPLLEAMACGCPVIASRTSSIPEVVGDAALLFDPMDESELAQHLASVLESAELRRDLIGRGFRNLERFGWASTAARTLAVYRSCVSNGRSSAE